MGYLPKSAAIKGGVEVEVPIIAMTLTLAAIYTPITLLSSQTGVLAKEFALTLVIAVILSGITALTISPAIASKVLKSKQKKTINEKLLSYLNNQYERGLDIAINNKKKILFVCSILAALAVAASIFTRWELVPKEDTGSIMLVSSTPEGATLHYTKSKVSPVRELFTKLPEYKRDAFLYGFPKGNQSLAFISLTDWKERDRSSQDIINSVIPEVMSVNGVNSYPLNPFFVPGKTSRMPFEFALKSSGDRAELEVYSKKLAKELDRVPRLVRMLASASDYRPELGLKLHTENISAQGASINEISNTVRLLHGYPLKKTVTIKGNEFKVVPQIITNNLTPQSAIKDVPISTANGVEKFKVFGSLESGFGRSGLSRFQEQNSVDISGIYVGGLSIADAINITNQKPKRCFQRI